MTTIQMNVRPEDLQQVPQGQERIPEGGVLVIFGASGDLTKRKLLPALYHLYKADLLPQNFAIVGVARRPLGAEFAADMRAGILEFGDATTGEPKLDEFIGHIEYYALNFDDPASYTGLKAEKMGGLQIMGIMTREFRQMMRFLLWTAKMDNYARAKPHNPSSTQDWG